jgi:hypothetical protein
VAALRFNLFGPICHSRYVRSNQWLSLRSLLEGGNLNVTETVWLWHPSYAPVRKTEGFKSFAREAGFVEYWRAKGWPDVCHPTTGDDFECN